MNKIGNVIILNGTSSSGKTTIAKQIQSISSSSYLLCSLDAFWNMTPSTIPAGSKNYPKMKLALAKSVRALAETGHNVLVDIVFSGQKTYIEMSRELSGLNFKIIKIECPIEELNKRELARGDRKIGLAESQFNSVHEGVTYDLIINTFSQATTNSAQKIINFQ